MFTGIIETLGDLAALEPATGGLRITVRPRVPLAALQIGESIAVNGVCLTAEPASAPDCLRFFVSRETLDRTTLAAARPGDLLNIERALRADARLGGHLVIGHVDAIGTLTRLDEQGESWLLEVAYPLQLAPLIAFKGSIAVDGISLTVAGLLDGHFSAALVPHTMQATNLQRLAAGSQVNLEADILARYVARALETGAISSTSQAAGITLELLRRAGFE
jgi:riboflavin synthase